MSNFVSLLNWENIRAMQGRENLGESMPVSVYRLMQYGIFDELVSLYSVGTAERVIKGAGKRAGIALCENMLDKNTSIATFLGQLQKVMKELKIGLIRVEKADEENGTFTLTVAEDLDCSGLPALGETVCFYDEGFIEGVLEYYSGNKFVVREVDCWATGDRVCRFEANIEN